MGIDNNELSGTQAMNMQSECLYTQRSSDTDNAKDKPSL